MLLAKLSEAEALDKELQKELKQYADSDPTLLEAQSMSFAGRISK